jgi:hypothetical protein
MAVFRKTVNVFFVPLFHIDKRADRQSHLILKAG